MLETVPHEQALLLDVPVVANSPLAQNIYRLRLHCPDLAARFLPGQFLMLRLPGRTDPLLGRPFALYDTYTENGIVQGLDIVYLVIGKVTGLMAGLEAEDEVSVWGPLGNGFGPAPTVPEVLLVAGGIGQTPFLALARYWLAQKAYGQPPQWAEHPVGQVHLFYGNRTAGLVAGTTDFEEAGVHVHISTDDGSRGYRGFVTDLVAEYLAVPARPRCHVIGCGPEPMLKRLVDICRQQGTSCDLSLENYMACGIGACFSCVAPVRDDAVPGGADYRRVCVEGPVFKASKLAW